MVLYYCKLYIKFHESWIFDRSESSVIFCLLKKCCSTHSKWLYTRINFIFLFGVIDYITIVNLTFICLNFSVCLFLSYIFALSRVTWNDNLKPNETSDVRVLMHLLRNDLTQTNIILFIFLLWYEYSPFLWAKLCLSEKYAKYTIKM